MEILLAHLKDRITALRILKSLSGQKTQEQCNVNLNKFIKRAHLSGRNDYIYLLQAVLIVTAVSYVFYDSLIPVIIFSPYVIYHIKKQRFNERYQKDNELIRQFRDGMQAVSFALNTGYSIENSFAEALQELVMLYGQNAVIVADFNMIVNRIRRNENLEDVMDDYAARMNIADISYFAEIFRYAKRSGGDIPAIIKQTVRIIREKAEVQREIDTIISGRKMEQRD
jgi:tight adherence protein B